MAAPDHPVHISDKFGEFHDLWAPKILGQINDYQLKAVKVRGEFVWHVHDDTDEFFLVRSGELTIEMKGRADVTIGTDEFFVVPCGVEHRPVSPNGCEMLLLEPVGVVNTGDADADDMTAPEDDWI